MRKSFYFNGSLKGTGDRHPQIPEPCSENCSSRPMSPTAKATSRGRQADCSHLTQEHPKQ